MMKKANKKVLVLNGSFCEIPIIEECHKLGYYVITTGNAPSLVGHNYSDEYIQADYSDYDAILQIVKTKDISHILSCANDFGSITASYVAEKMGWKGHDSFENAKLLHHKDLFKNYIQGKGYPTPISKVFDSFEDASKYVCGLNDFPVIVKANDLTGGKGIQKADNKKDALDAIENSFLKSRSKHILIEPYIDGNQQTFVTFLHDGKVVASNSCDSYSYVNPYLIQSETLPAEGIELVKGKLIAIIEEMAEDLKLADGILAFQYFRKGDEVQIIEMMRRPFGNQFLKLVEYSSDFPWHLAQVIAETDGDWNKIRPIPVERPFCGHYGVMVQRNGRLKSWSIPEEIKNHVFKQFVMKQPGDEIADHLNERVAFLHFEYDNMADMCRDVKSYYDRINVDVE